MTITLIPGWRSVSDSKSSSPSVDPSLISSNTISKTRCRTRSKDSSGLGVVAISNPRAVKNHLSRVRKFSSSSTTKTDLGLLASGDGCATDVPAGALNLIPSCTLSLLRNLLTVTLAVHGGVLSITVRLIRPVDVGSPASTAPARLGSDQSAVVVHRAEESHAEYILYLYSVKTLYRALRWSHSLTTFDRQKRKGCASSVVPNQGPHSAMAIPKANVPADFTRIKIFYDWGLCEDYWRATGGQSKGVHRPAALFLQGHYPTLSRSLTPPLKITTRPFAAGLGADDARGKRLRATGIPVARGIYCIYNS